MAKAFLEMVLTDGDGGFRTRESRTLERKRKGPPVAEPLVFEPGRLDEDVAELAEMNRRGKEIFITMNEAHPDVLEAIGRGEPTGKKANGKPNYGTLDKHIVATLWASVDIDTPGVSPTANFELIEASPIPPTLIVNTSGNKYQLHFRVDGLKVSDYKRVQKALIAHFGGDKAVCNPARIMRVPGFLHLKGEPQLSVLLPIENPDPIPVEEFFRAFGIPLTPPAKPEYEPAPADPKTAASDWGRVLSALERWPVQRGERHGLTLRALCLAAVLGVQESVAVRDMVALKRPWVSGDDRPPEETVPEAARWAYAQTGGPTAGQLAGTLRKDYGLELPRLKAESRQTVKAELEGAEAHDLTILDERWPVVPLRGGVNLVRSPMGTGKTEGVRKLLQDNPAASVVYVSHLISLAEANAYRLGLDSYTEMQRDHYRAASRLSICVNSLPHLIDETTGKITPPDILVIDEVEQVLRRLTDRTVAKKDLLMSVLRFLLARSETVVLLDAHLSTVTLKLVERWRRDERFNVVVNTHQVARGRTLELLPREGDAMLGAVSALERGERVWFGTNQKNSTAEGAYALLTSRLPDKRVLLVSSDTTGDREVQAFLKNPNGELGKWDAVIATPSINSGVSIDEGHDRTWVGGSFGALSNTPTDVMQALGRVRGASTLHVHVAERREELPTEPEGIRLWDDAINLDSDLLGIDPETGRVGIRNPDYERLYVDVKVEENKQRLDFRAHVLALAATDGYEILEGGGDAEAKETSREAKELAFAAYVAQVEAAPDVDEAAAARLRTPAVPLTLEQTRTLERHDLRAFFDAAPEEVGEVATADERGRLKSQLLNVATLKADDETLKKWRKAGRDTLLPDLEHAAVKREVFRRVLSVCGLDWGTWELETEEREVKRSVRGAGFGSMGRTLKRREAGAKRYTLKDFAAVFRWLEEHRAAVSRVFRLPSKEKLACDLRFVGSVLRSLGLKQHRARSDKGFYQLDTDRLAHIREWYARACKGVEHLKRLSIEFSAQVSRSSADQHGKRRFVGVV